MTNLAVIILTKNEEIHIARAIRSLAGCAREIFVVDSFSTDRTKMLATELGATVVENIFINYANQFQWALDNLPISTDWVMRLDADEVLDPDLVAEIETQLPTLPAGVVGINLKRKHIFLGRWIRFGGRYPLFLLRIWRRGKGRIENRWMDEHMIVSGGHTITFNACFSDHNLNDLSFFVEKHNKYATREAIDILNQEMNLFPRDVPLSSHHNSLQATVRRHIKEQLYNKTPFYLASLGYFFMRYIFQGGFLDGVPGLIYHFLQAFWYRFLVGAKVFEFRQALRHIPDREHLTKELSRLSGHDLTKAESRVHSQQ